MSMLRKDTLILSKYPELLPSDADTKQFIQKCGALNLDLLLVAVGGNRTTQEEELKYATATRLLWQARQSATKEKNAFALAEEAFKEILFLRKALLISESVWIQTAEARLFVANTFVEYREAFGYAVGPRLVNTAGQPILYIRVGYCDIAKLKAFLGENGEYATNEKAKGDAKEGAELRMDVAMRLWARVWGYMCEVVMPQLSRETGCVVDRAHLCLDLSGLSLNSLSFWHKFMGKVINTTRTLFPESVGKMIVLNLRSLISAPVNKIAGWALHPVSRAKINFFGMCSEEKCTPELADFVGLDNLPQALGGRLVRGFADVDPNTGRFVHGGQEKEWTETQLTGWESGKLIVHL